MTTDSIRRMGAFATDMLLVSVAYTVLLNLIPEERMSHDWFWKGRSLGCAFDLYGFLTAAYFVGSDLLNKGESPGKDIFHLKTVGAGAGEELGYHRTLARTLLKLISIWMLPVSAFVYLWKGRGFTLQDFLTHTGVRPVKKLKAT